MNQDSSVQPALDVQHLHDQLAADPGNPGLQSRYFWALHQHVKSSLEAGDSEAAARGIGEMARVQLPLEKAANATGWAVHRYLKAAKDDPKAIPLDETAIGRLLEAYAGTLPYAAEPDKLHSAMLWVSIQLQGEDRASWFVPLVRTVGFERMQGTDFEGKEVNGYLLPSLAERVAVAAAKQVEMAPSADDANWLMPHLDRLLREKPQNVWLKYHKAKLLLAMDCRQEARDYVQPVVTGKRTEFWAWAVLGEIYAQEDPAKALPCFCKAITLKDDEVFLLGVREQLALVLAALGRHAEAKAEAEKLAATRRNKNFRIPGRIAALMQEPWYAECQAADNTPLYIREARSADDLLFDDAEACTGVVTNIDTKSRSCFVTFRLDCSARYRYHRTPWGKELPQPGMFVTVRVRHAEAEGVKRYEAISMQPSMQVPDPSFAREFSGAVKIIAKPEREAIGFVGDIFIPSILLRQSALTNGARAAGVAVREMNRTKGEYGWRAVRVSEALTPAAATPAPVPEG